MSASAFGWKAVIPHLLFGMPSEVPVLKKGELLRACLFTNKRMQTSEDRSSRQVSILFMQGNQHSRQLALSRCPVAQIKLATYNLLAGHNDELPGSTGEPDASGHSR